MKEIEMAFRLDEIALANHDLFVDEVPHWAFRTLREHDPVHWQGEPTPNSGFWAVTCFHDIEEVLRDTRTFSSIRGITLEEQDPEEVEARRSMIDMDPPKHTRLRRLVSKLFTRSAFAPILTRGRSEGRSILPEPSASPYPRSRSSSAGSIAAMSIGMKTRLGRRSRSMRSTAIGAG